MSAGYYCRECSRTFEAFAPKCPSCKGLNTLLPGSPRDGGWVKATGGAERITDVVREDKPRIRTGTRELDRVLGGGFGIDAAYIISGDPGTGKSTLCLQVGQELADAEVDETPDPETGKGDDPYTVLYVAAEEPKGQIAGRSDRLFPDGPARGGAIGFYLANESEVFGIEKLVAEHDPDMVIVDSVNVLTMRDLDAPAGSVSAIRACATHLVGVCKARKACLWMIAHVNKQDELSGPKTFEHLVDGVMHLSDEPPFRVLRMSKHRLAPTSEVGIFRMAQDGLRSVENPSELLLASRRKGAPGSVVAVASEQKTEGASRALCLEVQALATARVGEGGSSTLSCIGLEGQRVRMLLAVLGKHHGFSVSGETYASIAGGVRMADPGLDLGVVLALVGSALGEAVPDETGVFGEIGLSGELRPPRNVEGRLRAAGAMGFRQILAPPLTSDEKEVVKGINRDRAELEQPKMNVHEIRSLAEAFDLLGWDVGIVPTRKP